MAKRISLFMGILIACLLLTGSAMSQECLTTISLGSLNLERNVKTFTVPVNIENPCPVGGIQIYLTTNPPDIITPVMADTTSSRIAGWEQFSYHNSPTNPDTLIVFGVANMPAEPDTPPLEIGDGLLFNLTLQFECGYEDNITVDVVMGPAFVSDPDGDLYENISTEDGVIGITPFIEPRGDANCDGMLIGGDVSYLVNYFLGNLGCPCALCAGDVNGDGIIIGGDVTYLVTYFMGGAAPPPCDE